MTKRKPKAPGAKVRKPLPMYRWDGSCRAAIDAESARISQHFISPEDARRIAAWLVKFADWADAQAARLNSKTKEKK